MRVLVVNGPNLNLLGVRNPEVYGRQSLADLEQHCLAWGTELGLVVETFQSNHEGAIIDRLHAALGTTDGIVINPGALTHYSYALHDAIEAVAIPTVEVHLSDILSREPWRAHSVLAPVCLTSIAGRGFAGYRDALVTLANLSR
jgi:3-dehydroquinate dehydratase-2